MVGRALIRQGEFVAAIDLNDGRVVLHPTADWDVTGGHDAEGWNYRIDLAGPSQFTTRPHTPAPAVIHATTAATPPGPGGRRPDRVRLPRWPPLCRDPRCPRRRVKRHPRSPAAGTNRRQGPHRRAATDGHPQTERGRSPSFRQPRPAGAKAEPVRPNGTGSPPGSAPTRQLRSSSSTTPPAAKSSPPPASTPPFAPPETAPQPARPGGNSSSGSSLPSGGSSRTTSRPSSKPRSPSAGRNSAPATSQAAQASSNQWSAAAWTSPKPPL